MAWMTELEPTDAPARSAELLNDILGRHGSAGAMVRMMAHSPALLQGYLELSRAIKRATLPRPLAEKVSLAVQEWIGCQTCLSAHATAATNAGLSEADIEMARQGVSTDARETALLSFAVRVLAEPATLVDRDLAELREHGWSDRVVGDVVGLVALNQLTGSFNLVAGNQPGAR